MEESNPFVFAGVVVAILYVASIAFLLSSLHREGGREQLIGALFFLLLPIVALYLGYNVVKKKSKKRG